MLAKRVGMMYSTTMTNEQPTTEIAPTNSRVVRGEWPAPEKKLKQIKLDGGLSETGLKEYSDCTIRALALCANIKYDVAHKVGKDAGRKNRCRFSTVKLIKEAKKNGLKFFQCVRSSVTISKFIQRNPKGRFYCRRSGHAFALVDGVILDTTPNSAYQRITHAWEFVSEAEDSSCQTALDNVI